MSARNPVELAEGDTVQVASGGPEMTVELLSRQGKMARVIWFDEKKGSFCREVLAATALEIIPHGN